MNVAQLAFCTSLNNVEQKHEPFGNDAVHPILYWNLSSRCISTWKDWNIFGLGVLKKIEWVN